MRWYALKDGVALVPLAWSAGADTLLLPSALMDQELYQAVNTMSTPEHIVPEPSGTYYREYAMLTSLGC